MLTPKSEGGSSQILEQYRLEINKISNSLGQPEVLRLILRLQPDFFTELGFALDLQNPADRFKKCQDLIRKSAQLPEVASITGAFASMAANTARVGGLNEELKAIVNSSQLKISEIKHSLETQEHQISEELDNFLQTAKPVDHGVNALVYKWEYKDQGQSFKESLGQQGAPNAADAAVKVLKLYESGTAKDEYERQMTAWNIFHAAGIQKPAAPKPYLFKDVQISGKTAETLNGLYKTHLETGHAEALVMDFVPGHDFQHFILSEALRLKGVKENFGSIDSQQLYFEAVNYFNLDQPAREDSPIARAKIRVQNLDFIYRFIGNHGVKISPEIIQQFSVGIQIWEKVNFTHGDLHERNIMFTGSADQFFGRADAKDSKVVFLDFGKKDVETESFSYPDRMVLSKLKQVGVAE